MCSLAPISYSLSTPISLSCFWKPNQFLKLTNPFIKKCSSKDATPVKSEAVDDNNDKIISENPPCTTNRFLKIHVKCLSILIPYTSI